MFLNEIKPGQKVFIDANIFVYHFSQSSSFNKSCTDFLVRVENSELHGITSAAVIQEATHRLMMVEASAAVNVEVKNLPKYLKQNSDIVKQLTHHLVVPSKIINLNIEIAPPTPKLIVESQAFKIEYGILSNDSLTIKVMKELGISNLASNDLDFKRVDWLNLYLPSSGL